MLLAAPPGALSHELHRTNARFYDQLSCIYNAKKQGPEGPRQVAAPAEDLASTLGATATPPRPDPRSMGRFNFASDSVCSKASRAPPEPVATAEPSAAPARTHLRKTD